jgi:EmrB/QacA subfamily drug resistance transporter
VSLAVGATSSSRDTRTPVLIALMITMTLSAVDSTVVTTAVPSIVRDLGGFSLFPWLFSIYLLTQAVTVPIYGRMADVFGRRPVLYAGIGMFLLGSILCGVAWNMTSLIVFRGLQGLGAGAIQPLVQTVVGDMYSVKERARIQGYTASVWGISSLLGPLLGGALSQWASWRWIFYINLPVGVVAVVLLQRYFHESIERKSHVIDYLGTTVLTAALTAFIFGLLQGGTTWAWGSPIEIGVLAAGAVGIALFCWVERRAVEPMIPPWVMTKRPLLAGNLANLAIGAALLGLSSYVPAYAQGVRRVDPVVSGLAIAAVTLGWPIASGYAGRLYLRIGFRATAILGGVLVVIGTSMFLTLAGSTPILLVAGYGFLTGIGMGLTATPVLVALQSLVGWERRGVVTASNIFARSIGSAVGIAVLGSVANSSLASWLRHPPSDLKGSLPSSVNVTSRILGGGKIALPGRAASFVREGLLHATHDVFIGIAGVSVFAVIALVCIPRRLASLDDQSGADAREGERSGDPAPALGGFEG